MTGWTRGVLGIFGILTLAALVSCAMVPTEGQGRVPTAEVMEGDFVRWVPADGELEAAESTPLSMPPGVRWPLRIAWLAPEGTELEPGDVAVRFDSTELEKTVVDLRADLESNLLRTRQRRARAEAQREQLRREVETARRELDHAREFASEDGEIFSRVEIIESRIDEELAAEQLAHGEQELRREAELVAADIEILAIERRKSEAELEAALETLKALELRAPAGGHLVYQRRRGELPEVGTTVFPGQTVAEIPHPGEMRVEAYVLEADAGSLVAGRRARVFPDSRAGLVLPAEVLRVDNVAKPRFRASPVQYFTVTLALQETNPEVLKPGLGVRVEILLESIDDALTVPRQAIFDRDERQVVYRRDGEEFEEVPVTLRASGRGRIAVEGELRVGDRVALADPAAPAGERQEEEGAADPGSGVGVLGAVSSRGAGR